jgi:hypothetical protein
MPERRTNIPKDALLKELITPFMLKPEVAKASLLRFHAQIHATPNFSNIAQRIVSYMDAIPDVDPLDFTATLIASREAHKGIIDGIPLEQLGYMLDMAAERSITILTRDLTAADIEIRWSQTTPTTRGVRSVVWQRDEIKPNDPVQREKLEAEITRRKAFQDELQRLREG